MCHPLSSFSASYKYMGIRPSIMAQALYQRPLPQRKMALLPSANIFSARGGASWVPSLPLVESCQAWSSAGFVQAATAAGVHEYNSHIMAQRQHFTVCHISGYYILSASSSLKSPECVIVTIYSWLFWSVMSPGTDCGSRLKGAPLLTLERSLVLQV